MLRKLEFWHILTDMLMICDEGLNGQTDGQGDYLMYVSESPGYPAIVCLKFKVTE